MLHILFLILVWFALMVLSAFLVLVLVWIWTGLRARVPYVPVPSKTLNEIQKALGVTDSSVLYDLGCGDGKVLFHVARSVPRAKYVGIENNIFPIILANIKAWWHKWHRGTDVKIVSKDFFKEDFSDATHIFTYLYPVVMDDLLPKFDTMLKPGTRLVSASFKFTQKQPIQEIDLGRGKYSLARKLYVYEF
jgi:cyclopropane fatty-acyl-phospholipid synthase-like methyltransferase